MEVKVTGGSVKVFGNIKSISDFQLIKSTIDGVIREHRSITIEVMDSLSMTSSVIGYLNKLVQSDKIDLSLRVGNIQLLALLDDLKLTHIFKASRI